MDHSFCPSLLRGCLRKSTAFLSIRAAAHWLNRYTKGMEFLGPQIWYFLEFTTLWQLIVAKYYLGTGLDASGLETETQVAEVNHAARFESLEIEFHAAWFSNQCGGALLKHTAINYSLRALGLLPCKGLGAVTSQRAYLPLGFRTVHLLGSSPLGDLYSAH